MKKIFTNKLAILMVLVMAFSCFALFGCSNADGTDTTTTTTAAADDAQQNNDASTGDEAANVATTAPAEVKVLGKVYKPYLARKDGKDVDLETVFGTGYAKHGDELVLNDDGTFTAYIGVTAGPDAATGTYEYNEQSNIVLKYNNDKTEEAVIVTYGENGSVQEFRILKGDVYVLFMRAE